MNFLRRSRSGSSSSAPSIPSISVTRLGRSYEENKLSTAASLSKETVEIGLGWCLWRWGGCNALLGGAKKVILFIKYGDECLYIAVLSWLYSPSRGIVQQIHNFFADVDYLYKAREPVCAKSIRKVCQRRYTCNNVFAYLSLSFKIW